MRPRILLTLGLVLALAVLALTHIGLAWSSGGVNSADESSQPMASVISSNVVINEFESNPPSGGSQYVELYNPTSSTVDVGGWTIRTIRGGNSYVIPAGTSIAAGGFYVATLPGQFINNAGDIIMLLSSQSLVVDQTPGSMLSDTVSPPDSRTWQRIPDAGTDWQFLNGTPGRSNSQTTNTATQTQTSTTSTAITQTSTAVTSPITQSTTQTATSTQTSLIQSQSVTPATTETAPSSALNFMGITGSLLMYAAIGIVVVAALVGVFLAVRSRRGPKVTAEPFPALSLEDLKSLLDMGLITQDDYDEQRRRLGAT